MEPALRTPVLVIKVIRDAGLNGWGDIVSYWWQRGSRYLLQHVGDLGQGSKHSFLNSNMVSEGDQRIWFSNLQGGWFRPCSIGILRGFIFFNIKNV